MLKIEENERLAALLTAQIMSTKVYDRKAYPTLLCTAAAEWRKVYQGVLREFMELEKAETADRSPAHI